MDNSKVLCHLNNHFIHFNFYTNKHNTMGTIKLSYTASEALAMMKQQFPKDYQEKINVGKALIVRLKKLYNKDTYQEAYQRYINSGCRGESAIMMLSALQQLIDEEKANYKNSVAGIMAQQNQIIDQQEALEADKNILELDRRALRQFYRERMDGLNEQLTQLCNTIEVVDAVIVSQPNLFSAYPISQ
jgi:hypothetical protein